MNSNHEDLLAFFREHRSNEANYPAICQRMDTAAAGDEDLKRDWEEIREKQGKTYEQAKETAGGSAWPEFEQFVSAIEKRLTA